MVWLAKIGDWINGITEVSVLLLALGVTWQFLFGKFLKFVLVIIIVVFLDLLYS